MNRWRLGHWFRWWFGTFSVASHYLNQQIATSAAYLVPADEFIAEGQAWHDAALLQPEDGSEGAREEDTFHGSEGHYSLAVGRVVVVDPADGPVSLLLDTGHGLDGIEEEVPERNVVEYKSYEIQACNSVVRPLKNLTTAIALVIHYSSKIVNCATC